MALTREKQETIIRFDEANSEAIPKKRTVKVRLGG